MGRTRRIMNEPCPDPRSGSSSEPASLSECLAAEMARRWRQGQSPPAEEFLDRHRELWDNPEEAADLVYEEVCLRQERGEAGAAAEVLRRFPQWREQLELLLRFHQLLEPGSGPPAFPDPGEFLGEFTLLAELGRGAVGRVFLANQPSLANRLVVLKLTPRDGQEHISLARLQHTNIVPVHSVQEDPARNLRVLCMPYFGGLTLARLLEGCADVPPPDRTGKLLLSILDRAQPADLVTLPPRGAARHFLARASYVQAVCAIGAALADALQYAHEHGLVHLDVKPSNILLVTDGQPMLLDFHLARQPIRAHAPLPEWLGGTLLYMSPEQRQALEAVRDGRNVPVAVDGRSDVHSLALVLYQALGGPFPVHPGTAPPRLERHNPRVTTGLADVIHKNLATRAADRYPTAEALAGDLRRHLADLPLRGVPNRSLLERWRKWRRRRPHTVRVLILGAAVLMLAAAFAISVVGDLRDQRREAHDLLAQGIALRGHGKHREAVQVLERGLAAAEASPLHTWLARDLREQLQLVRAEAATALLNRGVRLREAGEFGAAQDAFAQAMELAGGLGGLSDLPRELAAQVRLTESMRTAGELHAFADRVRFLYGYGAKGVPKAVRDQVVPSCRGWWERRHFLADNGGPGLPEALRQRATHDLLDLTIIRLDLDGVSGPQEALDVLAEAEQQFGPSCVMEGERARFAAKSGLTQLADKARRRAAELPPRNAWEWYAVGRSHLRSGEVDLAAAALRRAVRLQPGGLWPNFYEGVCAFQQGRYEDAVTAFSACVSLAPTTAECFYNRGLAYAQLKRADRALSDYDEALALAPQLAPAALNRGIIHLQEKRFEPASADFERALKSGADPALVHYNLALLHHARGDDPAAVKSLQRALEVDPAHKAAADMLHRLQK
jgi:serine/threonine protein kinase/Flp pilus assembly protein TadD